MADTSHSLTSNSPPKTSAARSRSGRTPSALACIDSRSRQDVVTMHMPDSRSASMDRPTQPSMLRTAGITSSRT